jgi:hypothetical protein
MFFNHSSIMFFGYFSFHGVCIQTLLQYRFRVSKYPPNHLPTLLNVCHLMSFVFDYKPFFSVSCCPESVFGPIKQIVNSLVFFSCSMLKKHFSKRTPMKFEASLSQFQAVLEPWQKVFIEERGAGSQVFIIAYGTKRTFLGIDWFSLMLFS